MSLIKKQNKICGFYFWVFQKKCSYLILSYVGLHIPLLVHLCFHSSFIKQEILVPFPLNNYLESYLS